MNFIFALAVGVFFGIGVFQMLRRDLIKAAMGYAMLLTAVNIFIMESGAYDAEVPAYDELVGQAQVSDPLVQALVLTAVVIGFGSFSLLLAIVNVISRRFDTIDSDNVDNLTN